MPPFRITPHPLPRVREIVPQNVPFKPHEDHWLWRRKDMDPTSLAKELGRSPIQVYQRLVTIKSPRAMQPPERIKLNDHTKLQINKWLQEYKDTNARWIKWGSLVRHLIDSNEDIKRHWDAYSAEAKNPVLAKKRMMKYIGREALHLRTIYGNGLDGTSRGRKQSVPKISSQPVSRKIYTAKEVESVRKMMGEKSDADIAQILGCRAGDVRELTNALRLPDEPISRIFLSKYVTSLDSAESSLPKKLKFGNARWTAEEKVKLREALELFGFNWVKVSDVVGRNQVSCWCHWHRVMGRGLVEDYTLAEDMLLIGLVERLGTKWKQMGDVVKGRTPESLRRRWRLITTQLGKDVKSVRERIGELHTPQSK